MSTPPLPRPESDREQTRCVDCKRPMTVAWYLASEAHHCGCRLEAAITDTPKQ